MKKIILLFFIVGVVFVSACTDISDSGISDISDTSGGDSLDSSGRTESDVTEEFLGSGKGTLILRITDKPSDLDLERVEVTISNIQVHIAEYYSEGNETGNETGNYTENGGSWITVVEEAQTFDLIEIEDVTEFLGSAELDAGKYTQVRLNVDSAFATINGTDHDLKIPSGNVKLVNEFDIEENETTTLTLDFDAQESVHASGKDYIMRPTIRILEDSDDIEDEDDEEEDEDMNETEDDFNETE